MKKILKISAVVLLLLIVFAAAHILYHSRDRNPGYTLDITLSPDLSQPATEIQVGLAKAAITPEYLETWVDADSNARYEPKKGDVYEDANSNGKFDAVWLAGFQSNRPAQGVHDDIWARAILWDDGQTRVALVSLDAIGFFHDDVIDVREEAKNLYPDIDHIIISSTHNHEVPDLMGLWGASVLKSGVNKGYM